MKISECHERQNAVYLGSWSLLCMLLTIPAMGTQSVYTRIPVFQTAPLPKAPGYAKSCSLALTLLNIFMRSLVSIARRDQLTRRSPARALSLAWAPASQVASSRHRTCSWLGLA